MVRIKTTTKNKAVFQSPFVFTDDQAAKKIKSIQKWHTWRGRPKFETVPVNKHHPSTVWRPSHPIFDPMMADSMAMLGQLENMWEKLSAAEYAKAQKVR